MSFFRTLLTGKDNKTYDAIRVLGLAIGFGFVFLGGYAVIKNKQNFDFMGYGTGAGLVVTAIGAALKLKDSTEPIQ